jgi:hypothetical protein
MFAWHSEMAERRVSVVDSRSLESASPSVDTQIQPLIDTAKPAIN